MLPPPPSTFTPMRSPDNVQKLKIWPVSKGRQNEETPQSMTKIHKLDPFHEVKIVPKLEKSTNCNHKVLSSEDAQDTSTCKMQGHFLSGFSSKCLKAPNLTHFAVKIATKLDKSTDHDPNLISSEGCQDKSACKFPDHSLYVFLEKWPETPNLTRFSKSK